MNITPGINPSALPDTLGTLTTGGTSSAGGSFASMISSAIGQVEGAQNDAKSAALNFLTQGQGEVYSVALTAQRADLSLELFQQVRNKFVSAYQEIMRMPM